MEFDWDEGNEAKNLKHRVHDWEIEEALDDPDFRHGDNRVIDGELRQTGFGRSGTSGKHLRIIYTMRSRAGRLRFRPISAVEMTATERARYLR